MIRFYTALAVYAAISDPAIAGAREQAIAEIRVAEKAFCDMAQTQGYPAAYKAYVAPDALMIRPGLGAPVPPLEEAEAAAKWGPETKLTWNAVAADASADGSLGYTWGHLTFHSQTPDGKPINSTGSYSIIWKRQADNRWKAVLDISTPGPKPAQK